MSYLDEKRGASSATRSALPPKASSPLFYGNPQNPTSYEIPLSDRNARADALAAFEQKDLVYKKRIRILRAIYRVVSLFLSAFIIGTMSYSLAKYFLTRNHLLPNSQQRPFPASTTLWPSIMLLAIAVVTFVMNFLTLIAYLCGVGAANKANSLTSYIGYVAVLIHFIVWAVSVGLFRMAKTGHDLWGYTCGSQSDAIQQQVQSYLNFGQLCTAQTGAWYSTILEAANYLITFATTILIFRRAQHKRKLAQARDVLGMGP